MIKKIIQVTILHPRYDVRIYQKISKSLAKKYNVILLCADGKGNEIKNLIEILDLGILKKSNFFLRILLNFRLIIKCFSLKGDCYHFHDPELIFAGMLLRLFNYKVIFDSHEHIPDDILDKYYIPKNFRLIISSVYALLEKFLLKFYVSLIDLAIKQSSVLRILFLILYIIKPFKKEKLNDLCLAFSIFTASWLLT